MDTAAGTHSAFVGGVRLWVIYLALSGILLGSSWVVINILAKNSAEQTVLNVATELAEADAALIGESFKRIAAVNPSGEELDKDDILSAVAEGNMSALLGLFAILQSGDLESLLEPLKAHYMSVHLTTGETVWEHGSPDVEDPLDADKILAVAITKLIRSERNHVSDSQSGDSIELVDSYVPLLNSSGEALFVFRLSKDVTASLAFHTSQAQSSIRSAAFTVIGLTLAVLGIFVFMADRRISKRSDRIMETERSLSEKLNSDNAELNRLNLLKNEFLSGLSHELKTPLTAMLGFASILSRNRKGNLDTDDLDRLETIERNGRRLDGMIGDLLELSRIESQRFNLEKASFNMTGLIRDIVQSFMPAIEEKRQCIGTEFDQEDIWVDGDEGRLAQVVTNLMSNASKYSPPQTQIMVSCSRNGDQLAITVEDQGPGIAENDQFKLFELFFRTDSAQKSSVGGTGIGLYVTKRIIDRHGGNIEVDSELGRGTLMKVQLPGLASPKAEPANPVGFSNRLDEIDEVA